MPNPPFITKSWYEIGTAGLASNYWTWAQVRVAVDSLGGVAPIFSFGVGSHSQIYDDSPDTTGRIFRGIPKGVGATFLQVPQASPSTDINWYFFWGGFYESPPESGIFVQGIGAGLADTEISQILDGSSIVCENSSFVSGASARDASGQGQFIGSFPPGPGPGSILSITTP